MEQRLSLITLGVRDIAASTRFYRKLGWQPLPLSNENVTFFQAGSILLGLYGSVPLAEDAELEPTTNDSFRGVALAYNTRSQGEVDEVLREAEQAGARISSRALQKFWGGYSGYFLDPDGHAWEVAWNPGFIVESDGSITVVD